MHVKISKKGRSVINDKKLASELVLTVVKNKQQLEEGKIVHIEGRNIGVKLVTTVKDSK